jgi:hypothetical protein
VAQDPRSENLSAEFSIPAVGCGFPRHWAEMERGMLRGGLPSSCFGPRSNPKGGGSQKSEMTPKDHFLGWGKPVPELLTLKSHPRFRSPRETLLSPRRASQAVARRYQLYIPFSSMYYYMSQIYLFIASFSSSLLLPKFHMKHLIFPDPPISPSSLLPLLSWKFQFHLFLTGNTQFSSEGEENFIPSTRLR